MNELSKVAERLIRPVGKMPESAHQVPHSAPVENAHLLYLSDDFTFACGLWQCEAGSIDIDYYPVNELCHIVQGELLIQDRLGGSLRLAANSVIVIPQGFRGKFIIEHFCQKLFASHGDPDSIALLCGLEKPNT